jgi:hypothetical protein
MPPPALRRRGLLGLVLSLPIFGRVAASPDAAPDTAPTFELVPRPVVGETLRYTFDSELVRDGVLAHRLRRPLRVEVVRTDDASTTIHLTFGPTTILAADPRFRPMLEAVVDLMQDLPAVIRLDASGRVDALENVEAMRLVCHQVIDRVLATIDADPARPGFAAALAPMLRGSVATDAMVAASVLKEPSILFGAMGRRYGLGDAPAEVRTEIVSPLGEGVIPVIGRFAVRGVDARRGRAELGWLMASDARAVARAAESAAGTLAPALQAAAQAQAAREGRTPPAAEAVALPARIDLDERADFQVDTRTAWPVSVRWTRRIGAGDRGRVDTNTFTRDDA